MTLHGKLVLLIAITTCSASVFAQVAAPPAPPDLTALAVQARLDLPFAAWCRGQFRPGHSRAFAAALSSTADGGRYVVLERDGRVTELASFTGGADLSCYTRAEAQKLNGAIARSETIHGQITPRWRTTVVCAFIDATTAVCWQYSPADGGFVKVGGWVT
ncbi:MAG TPA: hypothetical protein VNJ02_03390 [Vicinamibacterales bacterium]|nr:hypothetical protein [Vicinamibacterales bacterium]